MNTLGSPDLLGFSRISREMARVDASLSRVAGEVTSGLAADPIKAAGGDAQRLYGLARDISLADRRTAGLKLAAGAAETTQAALGRVQEAAGAVGAPLAAAVARGDAVSIRIYGEEARGAFEDAVSALNTRFAGRALFAGAATDGAALADPAAMLAEIGARVAGAADAAAAIAAVDDYFADPAGFGASGYLGAAADAPDVEMEEGVRLAYAVRADEPALKQTLAALAMAVIGAEGGFAGGDAEARKDVLSEAAARGLQAVNDVVVRRGELGGAEERLESASVRTASELNFLKRAQTDLIARDPFEAATELRALEGQIQTVFTVTARLASLSLTGFLR